MMRPVVSALIAALLVPPLSLAAPWKAWSQTAPADSQSPQNSATPQHDNSMSFDDRIARFIVDFYLSGEQLAAEDLEQLYAERVTYFEKGLLPRAQIISDKQRYYARWTTRKYRMLRGTLRVERHPGAGKVFDIGFEYVFDVSSNARTSRGRGRALLTLDLVQDGGRITRETGTVIERW